MSSLSVLWWIAVLSMVCDHVGALVFPHVFGLRLVGRLAYPIFAFGVAQGVHRTRDVDAYLYRLVLLVLISEPVHYWVFGAWGSPVLWLLIGAGLCVLAQICVGCCLLGVVLLIVLGAPSWWFSLFPLFFYLDRHGWAFCAFVALLCSIYSGWYALSIISLAVIRGGVALSVWMPGRISKYLIYPAHLIALKIVSL